MMKAKKLKFRDSAIVSLSFSVMVFQFLISSCASLGGGQEDSFAEADRLQIPHLKNSPNECYFLDEFMPVPDSVVAGKHGKMNLRYYTYKTASYKDWEQKHIVLSFYSQDDHCWSLFEEAYVTR